MRLPDGRRLYTTVVLLPHAKFGRNDHREDAPHFNRISIYTLPVIFERNQPRFECFTAGNDARNIT